MKNEQQKLFELTIKKLLKDLDRFNYYYKLIKNKEQCQKQ
jgi:hypothetical protein